MLKVMATATHFEDLKVWQDARQLVGVIYSASQQRAFNSDFALRDQIRRAAVSTMSNIAEGFERGTRKEFIQFLNIAKGSNGEVRSQLYVAPDQKYVSESQFSILCNAAILLSKKLSLFIRYLDRFGSNSRVKKSTKAFEGKLATLQPSTRNLH
jgi:four helix bundle protein